MNFKESFLLVITAFMAAIWFAPATAVSAERSPLPSIIQQTRFIAYTPRSFSIAGGQVQAAAETGIRDDLKLLRPFFDGLITYASSNGVEAVPMVAHELGYRAVIMGIWDPLSETEIRNVITMAGRYPAILAAVIVGNEGIKTGRYLPEDVRKTMERIKKECPTLPITTSEPFSLYFEEKYADFFNSHDLLMPNVHPVFEKWFQPSALHTGVEMVLEVTAKLKNTYSRPLLIKETGLPSGQGSKGFTPERQALFWAEIFKRFQFSPTQSLACFEAFDAPWKPAEMATAFPGDHANEAFWGFFTTEGEGKPVVAALPKLENLRDGKQRQRTSGGEKK